MTESPPALRMQRDQGVLTVTFNRPEFGNAIPPEMVAELTTLFTAARGDPSVRAVLIRGEGPHFCAGGDVRGFKRSLEQSAAERQAEFGRRLDAAKAMVESYMALEVPVVAACQGAVAGAGLMFALAADIVLADQTVAFLFSHQRVGLPPDGGVSLLLPKVVGRRQAAELILTAARVEASEALRLGLASRLVESAELQSEGEKQAQRLARGPAAAVRLAKRLLAEGETRSASAQLDAERDAIVQAVGDADFEEGVLAFLEKRSPRFPSTR